MDLTLFFQLLPLLEEEVDEQMQFLFQVDQVVVVQEIVMLLETEQLVLEIHLPLVHLKVIQEVLEEVALIYQVTQVEVAEELVLLVLMQGLVINQEVVEMEQQIQ
jgi:hypothetical protein